MGNGRHGPPTTDATQAAHDAAARHPQIADLHAGSVYRGAWRLYRREPARVSVAALLLLGPGLVLGVGTGIFLDRVTEDTFTERVLVALVIGVIAAVIGTLGTVFYAGLLDELVGAVIRGGTPPDLGEVFRALPVWRLIAADLVVVLMAGAASSILVLPGFVLLAMLSTVGPVVNIERRGVFASIGRALSLTSRHIWLIMVTIGVPLAVELGVDHYLLHLDGTSGIWIQMLVSVPLILTIGVVVGLNEVVLAYALLARDPDSTVAEMVAASLERNADTDAGREHRE